MKKFISMVMAAAMVVSLVPATAFAANTATIKVVDDQEYTEDDADKYEKEAITGPEIQLKISDVDQKNGTPDDWDIDLDFDNAEVMAGGLGKDVTVGYVYRDNTAIGVVKTREAAAKEDTSIDLTVYEGKVGDDGKIEYSTACDFADDDIIVINVADLKLVLSRTSKGTEATVEVSGDFGDSDAMTFAAVLDFGLDVTLKKVADVAEEEDTALERDLKIETSVGSFEQGQILELKLTSGFEWIVVGDKDNSKKLAGGMLEVNDVDDRTLTVTVTAEGAANDNDTITILKDSVRIDAADAKAGDVCKITVKAKKGTLNDKTVGFAYTADAVEAVKVVEDKVTLSVDEDEDVPVIYSGVNVDNYGITDDSDHMSLEVTLEEAAKESLDVKKSFTMTLPEGVFVTNVDVTGADDVKMADGTKNSTDAVEKAFMEAYEEGEQECFEFKRKTFADSEDAFELTFELELIAEPGFEGEVTLTLGGDAFEDEQEVVIAEFVSPYTVEAQQNDLIIDYRNTEVPSNVVVKEAEAGLWAKDEMDFIFSIDKMDFENDVTFTVDDASDMEVKSVKGEDMGFKVDEESDDEPAVVTISDISLYMSRDLAAGAYDLELFTTAGFKMMTDEPLFTTDHGEVCNSSCKDDHKDNPVYVAADYEDWDYDSKDGWDEETFTVKEGFINIITAGRDQDD
ncbi:hypothetical protein, partial [Anaerotignum sp.]